MKVFPDTNVLFSAFATRGLSSDLFALVVNQHELITGSCVLAELERAFRSKLHMPDSPCAENLAIIRSKAVVVVASADEAPCNSDSADRLVLGEAIAGGAETFVTGDAALVALKEVSGMSIQSPRQFWEAARAR